MTTTADTLRQFYDGRAVCITGGAGFIGSHLAGTLVDMNAQVSIIDDLSNGMFENIVPWKDRITFIEASILDRASLTAAVDGVDVIFHQAALASVPRSIEVPEQFVEINTLGTVRVLEAARLSPRKPRIVYASSSSIYGDQQVSPKVETLAPEPRSPYAATKLTGESFLESYCHCFGMSGVSLRYFNIFGPRQRGDSPYAAVIPLWAEALLSGRQPIIYGDGLQTRDFTPVANAVHANLLAGAMQQSLKGESVNIGCGHAISLMQLLERMCDIYEVPAQPDMRPARAGDVRHSLASIERAQQVIDYQPISTLQQGLEETLAHYRQELGAV